MEISNPDKLFGGPFVVPDDCAVASALLDKVIAAMNSGVTDIDLQLKRGRGWCFVTKITVANGDDPSVIAQAVQACADRDASNRGAEGRYRAQIRIGLGETRQNQKRSYAQFAAGGDGETESSPVAEGWEKLVEAQSTFVDGMVKVNLGFAESRLRQEEVEGRQQQNLLTALLGPALRGIRIREEAQDEIARARAAATQAESALVVERERRQHETGNNQDSQFWNSLEPFVQTVGGRILTRLAGDEPKALPPAKSAGKKPAVEATAAQQPSDNPPLHETARTFLGSLDPVLLLRLARLLPGSDEIVAEIWQAQDEGAASRGILKLQRLAFSDPGRLVDLKKLLGERLKALGALAALAKQIANEAK